MSLVVKNPVGETVQLAPALAQGGEACVHPVPMYANAVVKMYHDHVLDKRGVALRAKVEAMSGEPQFQRLKAHPYLGWPWFSVFDEQGRWRGYAMRKAQGVRLNILAHSMAYRDHFGSLDRPTQVDYLLTLFEIIEQLHNSSVYIGDYNPANFLCEPGTALVSLIDCDSWQIKVNGRAFHCPVAAADMLPPELHNQNLDRVERSIESERFSLAILLFKVLMLGRHPFDVIGGASPIENIRHGHFPYGVGGGGIPKGQWFNIWSHLPFDIKTQLVKTFKQGASDPCQRTSLSEWLNLLHLYRRNMSRGFHETALIPHKPKSKEYKGSRDVS